MIKLHIEIYSGGADMKDLLPFSFDKNALNMLPRRAPRSNKGDYGRLLCICGSEGMAGAAYLCAKAAYRSGAGLVEIFTHRCNVVPLQASLPEAIITPYDDGYTQPTLIASLERADAIVIGCGLGVTPLSRKILSDLLRSEARLQKPLLIDADAINLLARNRSLLKYVKGAILTPHFMEASRLLDTPINELMADTCAAAHSIASRFGAICVMKDHESAVSDGSARVYTNKSGNAGMATAGSGDVLAGIIGGLLAQTVRAIPSVDSFGAATLGVYIHGLAGDGAALRYGEYSLMASDIIDAIPAVLSTRGV